MADTVLGVKGKVLLGKMLQDQMQRAGILPGDWPDEPTKHDFDTPEVTAKMRSFVDDIANHKDTKRGKLDLLVLRQVMSGSRMILPRQADIMMRILNATDEARNEVLKLFGKNIDNVYRPNMPGSTNAADLSLNKTAEANLKDQFDAVITSLSELEFFSQKVDALLNNPLRYAYPSSASGGSIKPYKGLMCALRSSLFVTPESVENELKSPDLVEPYNDVNAIVTSFTRLSEPSPRCYVSLDHHDLPIIQAVSRVILEKLMDHSINGEEALNRSTDLIRLLAGAYIMQQSNSKGRNSRTKLELFKKECSDANIEPSMISARSPYRA